MKNEETISLTPHFRIETSLSNGIKYLLQSSETQIVAVDNFKTLKFYEFIDKEKKDVEERQAAEEEKINKGIKEILHKYDVDKDGLISFDECYKILYDYFKSVGVEWITDAHAPIIFSSYDVDNSGKLSKYELKTIVRELMNAGYLKPK
jgi:Ca2+-binding EF-hand superfamily protein